MRSRFITVAGLFALSLGAQVQSPRVATVRYGHSVHAIFGLTENYVVGPRLFENVRAAAFSDRFGLLARDGEVQMVNADGAVLGSVATDDPEMKLDIRDRAESATVWLPGSGMLYRWSGNQFVATPASSAPEAEYTLSQHDGTLAVTAGSNTAEFRFPSGPFRCERAGQGVLHLTSNGQHWLLHLEAGRITLGELSIPRSGR